MQICFMYYIVSNEAKSGIMECWRTNDNKQIRDQVINNKIDNDQEQQITIIEEEIILLIKEKND